MLSLFTLPPSTMMTRAEDAATIAARKWLHEAQNKGPQFNVLSGGATVGTMLDLCGNSYLKFHDMRGRHAKAFKRAGMLSSTGALSLSHELKFRQESGLHKAAMRAALASLIGDGVEGLRLHSYID